MGAVGAALVMSLAFGTRTLDVVYITGGALLAVTAVGVARLSRPEAVRRAPEYGAVGDSLAVELEVEAEKPVSATVRDDHNDGIEADAHFVTVADGRPLEYDAHIRKRGVHRLGPLAVAVGDVFGLWQRVFTYEKTHRVVAYPRVRPLYGSAGLLSGYVGLTEERGQFDGIRDYERGDALRDVNWKASAKRPDELVVTEYAGEGASSSITVAIEAGSDARADAAAEAAASLIVHLLNGGLSVGVVTPRQEIGPGAGESHRRTLLEALARLRMGSVDATAREEADASVRAPTGTDYVTVSFGANRHRFQELVGRAEEVEERPPDDPDAAAAADTRYEVEP